MTGTREIVRVEIGERSYALHVGRGNLDQIGACLAAVHPGALCLLVTDDRVERLYAQRVASALRESGLRVDTLSFPAGRESKSLAIAEGRWSELAQRNATRGSVLVALGGGVVGDLAGFVATTYARGLPFWQIPTTLIAQVDSSVGGKVGINLPQAKNMVGAFWQPAGVLIDTETLSTLPAREYQSGLA